jgi:hypothetical protein
MGQIETGRSPRGSLMSHTRTERAFAAVAPMAEVRIPVLSGSGFWPQKFDQPPTVFLISAKRSQSSFTPSGNSVLIAFASCVCVHLIPDRDR